MRRAGIVLFLGGCLWLIGVDVVQAESWHRTGHAHRSGDNEMHGSNASRKEVSFEILRMLSTGMTKTEVLSRAGAPRYKFGRSGGTKWVYTAADSWTVEVAFGGDRVAEVNWSRTRP